ncbi:MAG TPA: UDP-2,3-diacylglucosamine diphosphatase [Polaromonas sp.]|uniref:UDP-2,3-diacylglucosamine diphosphatase n=1 Tax=Polaromonas sp. TaxID=1869339 RepID=UPI002D3D19DD|nr:UDP-2,3-diacylglucosamine diphosphatase [Polaromonas sp.]HYW55712.1 UDP-2,3-diacylglucosamine diphosphatase [Polaromonas sp.]
MPHIAELQAPSSWRSVDFISDLHLQASEPATFDAWKNHLLSTPAHAVFMLGDLFEVWVGDDLVTTDTSGFEAQCARVLQQAAARRPQFFMHGNRDFLVGQPLMAMCKTALLDDPTVLIFANQRWLLSHGDALCLDDTAYMTFRQQVRSPEWQQDFLAKPLAERQVIARELRQQSEARKRSGADYADVDSAAAVRWLQAAKAPILVHGHTHKPATHDLGQGFSRVVLSDWDLCATPPRAEVLRISASGMQRLPLA